MFDVIKSFKNEHEFLFYLFCSLLAVITAAVGLFILVFNFAVARIFMSKKKLFPSDTLIIAGLIGDGVYGLIFACTPIAILAFLHLNDQIPYYIKFTPILWLMLDSSSTLYSLLMIFFMTVNRYIAVVKPFNYKRYFRQRNVLSMIVFVLIITTIFLAIGVVWLAFPEKIYFSTTCIPSNYYCKWPYNQKVPDNLHTFYIFIWPQIQLGIVIIDSLLMIYVYIGVANSYQLNIFSFLGNRIAESVRSKEVQGNPTTTKSEATCSNEING